MNKQRRKEIKKAISKISELKDLVENILSEEQEAYENMPEGIQASENGMNSEEAQESLEAACEAIEEAICCLEEI